MCKKKILLYFASFQIFFLGFYITCFSQDSVNTLGRVNISSPNAASLGKYGDVPVSYHTGIPSISIPLYTVKSGSLSLPISLSYYASGLKVQEQASWVGAGWSLNAGGMITRAVRGAADDRGNNNGYVNKGYYSDSGYYNYLFVPDYTGGNSSTTHTGGLQPDDEQFVANRKDGEPDMYTFNFNGHSGKFYFNDDQSAVLVPEEDLKIQADLSVGPGFLGFIITTPDGNKYYFGKTGGNDTINPIENTFFITTQSSYGLSGRVASSWFLNKIMSADGMDSILLNYQRESYSFYELSMFPVYYTTSGQSIIFIGPFGSYPYEYDVAKNFIQGMRLSSITFPNGSVTFNAASSPRADLAYYNDWTMHDTASSDAKALESIQISDNGNFCKKFKFYTGYFYDNVNGLNGGLFSDYPTTGNITTDKYRLRLDSVQEVTCDSSIKIPPYRFSYFSELVPRKLSFGIDHWGFYNGVTNNTTLLPPSDMTTASSYTSWTGANRDAAWPSMRGGSLQKISYPTGGYTKFEFEANSTYTTYTQNVITSTAYLSDGFDGNTTYPKADTFTTASTPYIYQFIIQSMQTSGDANVQIVDMSNTALQGSFVTHGNTVTLYFPLSANTTYAIKSYNNHIESGHGININLNAIVPTIMSGNATVGGLRIKTITNKDSVTANDNITSYSYTQANVPNGVSSGILYSRPAYIQIMRNDEFGTVWGLAGFPNGCPTTDISTTKSFYRSPCSFRPMETI